MKTLYLLLLTLFVSTSLFGIDSDPINPRNNAWAKLAHKAINLKHDRDEITVKLLEDKFTAVRLAFQGGEVNMHHAVIHYANGETQNVPMKRKYTKGQKSRIIDLRGGQRSIAKVEVHYYNNHRARKKAHVEIWAKQ